MSLVLSPATSSLQFKVFKYFTLNYLTYCLEASGVPASLKVLYEPSLHFKAVTGPRSVKTESGFPGSWRLFPEELLKTN